ncbi:Conserved hypothetical protein [gamma proteobacterium HdN1]|nr:Conserved hypothetical protein [gamma proteobacterium HdN1]
MASYSPERKSAAIAKMLPPHNKTAPELHRSEGISLPTLYNWRKQAKAKGSPVPGNVPTPEDWSAQAKLAAIIETAIMTELELGKYCRSKGLYVDQLKRWKAEFVAGYQGTLVQTHEERQHQKALEKELKQTRSELRRKEKALAEAAALLVLQKKLDALWDKEAD